MPAPKGNRFWQARSSHGRKPIFENPNQLWAACTEYFEWVEDNPLWEDRVTSYQGENKHEPVAKMRAMTIAGICNFLDIARSTWDEYGKKEGFSEVVTRAESIMSDQKFAGAAANLLNAKIIARDLGLSDKREHIGDVSVTHTDADPRQIARAVLAIINRAKMPAIEAAADEVEEFGDT